MLPTSTKVKYPFGGTTSYGRSCKVPKLSTPVLRGVYLTWVLHGTNTKYKLNKMY